ncbi:MAG: glutamine synthetase [Myxococcales bacterium]|nr:glutamine synthetase [Myxococcales bacterium]
MSRLVPDPNISLDELRALLDREQIRFFRIGVFDVDGILRGKHVCRDKFFSVVEKGFGFCDVVLGWDAHDKLYDNTQASGWHTGYRDAPVRLDLSTLRRLPHEPDTILVLGDFAGSYAEVCPRRTLRRVLAKAEAMGYTAQAALEYEFFLFSETPQSVREKGYRDLTPVTPGMFGYSVLRSSVLHEFHQGLLELFDGMEVEIEGLHTETGPGVLEAAIRHDDALVAADKAALLKTFTKVFAQRHGLMATFMAKWSTQYPGQSGHAHTSLFSVKDGRGLFFEGAADHGMSALMRQYIAGQVSLMPEVLPMVCSTINSYRRMVPGMWAPLSANWGVENRTTAIRVIPGSERSQRSEYRIGPADANPYLILAAAIGSGLHGIERALDPGAPIQGSAYDLPSPGPGGLPLPRNLAAATHEFKRSASARRLFGDAFVEHYAATREWEVREYERHVSDWDLARYFEII